MHTHMGACIPALFLLDLFTTGAVFFVPHQSLTDETTPSTSHQYYNMIGKTEPVDESDVYVYMDAPVQPQCQKQPLYPGSPPQPPSVLSQHQKSGVASLGNSPVMQSRKQDSQHQTSSDWQKHCSLRDRSQSIDG